MKLYRIEHILYYFLVSKTCRFPKNLKRSTVNKNRLHTGTPSGFSKIKSLIEEFT